MLKELAALSTLCLVASCGQLGLGTGVPNDPPPSGTIVTQGSFVGLNGRAVSGIVSVYQDCSVGINTCNYTVRLQQLSAPAEAGLAVVPVINGAASLSPSQYALRASGGNQNYVFTGGVSTTSFTQVAIQPNSTTPNNGGLVYGIATLQPVN